MRTIRSISIAMFLLGVLFKTLHWPGAAIILFSGTALSAVTLASLLVRRPGPWSVLIERPVMLFGSISIALVGLLFKMMHWPGANIMLLIGLMTCAAWFLTSSYRTTGMAQRS